MKAGGTNKCCQKRHCEESLGDSRHCEEPSGDETTRRLTDRREVIHMYGGNCYRRTCRLLRSCLPRNDVSVTPLHSVPRNPEGLTDRTGGNDDYSVIEQGLSSGFALKGRQPIAQGNAMGLEWYECVDEISNEFNI